MQIATPTTNSTQTPRQPIEASELWQFSITTYQQADLQQQLLSWQNSYDGNVNLALFCLYCDDLNIQISDTELDFLHQQVSQFSIQFTQSVRVTREHFKQQKALLTEYDNIRGHLIEAELLLEQQEQSLICSIMGRDDAEFKRDIKDPQNWTRYQSFLTHSHTSLK